MKGVARRKRGERGVGEGEGKVGGKEEGGM